MIKIGILTFHRAHNYGAVLQAFALMTTLKNMGHHAEIIDYWPTYRLGDYSPLNFKSKSKNNGASSFSPKEIIKKLFTFPDRLRKYLKFNNFIKNNLEAGNTSYRTGAAIPDTYDVVICGSDQIWRYNFDGHDGYDEVYFAKYPLSKRAIKISYAASMGDKTPDAKAKEVFEKLIANFDLISVREDSLLELVKSLTAKPPVKVLDPVFLLSEPEWRKIIPKNNNKKKYLLFYQLLQNNQAITLAKKIAKERQLEIIEIRGISGNVNPFAKGNAQLSAGPIDFISLIAYADYVVSTSYHGVVFSIVFQKPFSALGFNQNSYRTKTLLASLGIEHCLIEKNAATYPETIDYTAVNTRLQEMINGSVSFLKTSIVKPATALHLSSFTLLKIASAACMLLNETLDFTEIFR